MRKRSVPKKVNLQQGTARLQGRDPKSKNPQYEETVLKIKLGLVISFRSGQLALLPPSMASRACNQAEKAGGQGSNKAFKGLTSSEGTTAGSSRRLLATMSFLIRPWAKRDIRDVMRLVKELAVSHNALHQVRTSPEALQKDGFEKDAIFGYLVAEVPPAQKSKDGHTIIGYQFHYLTYCTWDGPILFGRGIGTALLNHAAKITLEKGCSQFRFISAEKPQATADFFHKRGAVDVTLRDNWHIIRTDRDPLVKLVEDAAAKPNPVSLQL
ncbi:hypothetical protein E2320_014131 [Naja naja]|nr:hypothetical protein E2320_014131 [Naja naja]